MVAATIGLVGGFYACCFSRQRARRLDYASSDALLHLPQFQKPRRFRQHVDDLTNVGPMILIRIAGTIKSIDVTVAGSFTRHQYLTIVTFNTLRGYKETNVTSSELPNVSRTMAGYFRLASA